MRCDESMKRSKERCQTKDKESWRCTKDCEHCICAMFKQADGTERHRKVEKK